MCHSEHADTDHEWEVKHLLNLVTLMLFAAILNLFNSLFLNVGILLGGW